LICDLTLARNKSYCNLDIDPGILVYWNLILPVRVFDASLGLIFCPPCRPPRRRDGARQVTKSRSLAAGFYTRWITFHFKITEGYVAGAETGDQRPGAQSHPKPQSDF